MAVATAASAAVALLPGAAAHAAIPSSPASAPEATVPTLTPSSGNSETPFTMTFGGPIFCQGSGSGEGYRANTYIAALDADPATFTWSDNTPSAGPGKFADSLYRINYDQFKNMQVDDVAAPEGFLIVYNPFQLFLNPLDMPYYPPGSYHVGVACVAGNDLVTRYWQTTITIASAATGGGLGEITWSVGLPTGAPATAPAVTAGQAGSTQNVNVSWTTPPANPAVDNFDVALVDSSFNDVVPPKIGLTTTSTQFTGVPYGNGYLAIVVAHNSEGDSPPGSSPAFNVVEPAPFEGPIYQEVTVSRPEGLIVLTQKCAAGSVGPTVDASPVDASGNPIEGGPIDLGSTVDPKYGQYPYPTPPTYPTYCSVDLGTASLIASDSHALAIGGATGFAGQFYEATGAIQPITVVDARDTDAGWHADVAVDPVFTGQGSGPTGSHDTFPGSNLGVETTTIVDSDPVGTYDQDVHPGAAVPPLTGGLDTAKPLATAAAGAGLGQATIDADLDLVIPLSVDEDVYAATLTFTLVTTEP